tara:strand:- start:427 stop:2745 length:2319 start_codon:yes stop_codon:yes gene_type:complete
MTRPVAAILAEGIGGAVGFNPNDPNILNTVSDMIGKDKQGPLSKAIRMMATNPDDPELLNRARNFAEIAGIGSVFELVFAGIQRAPDAGRAVFNWFNDTAKSAQQGTAFTGIPSRPDMSGSTLKPIEDISTVNIETSKRGNVLEISKIETPDNLRGQGLADQKLEQLINKADEDGLTLALTPSDAFGANKARLTKWYKRHGFVPNKGRNKNFETRESMVRLPKPTEPASIETVDDFDSYLRKVDPSNKIIPAEKRPNLSMGDMYGMLPRTAKVVQELDNGVTFHRATNGDYYATAFNPDVGEQDVVGYILGRENGTELAVVQEMQGKGIGSELQYMFRSENPFAPTGGLTDAGKRRLEQTYDRLRDDGVFEVMEPASTSVPASVSSIPSRPNMPGSTPVINDLSPGAVPEFEGSPSIAFRVQELPTPIKGSKGVGKVSPGDIGQYWDADYVARYGRQGDPNNPQDLDRAIKQATSEATFQLKAIESGKGWYDKDIIETWDASGEVFPELNEGLIMMPNPASSQFASGEEVSAEALRIITTAIASPLSFGNRPKPNFNTALKVLDGWLSTGRIPDMNPQTGKLWTMRNVSSQSLRLLQHMIDRMGVEGTAEWLMSPHTVKEIRDMKREPGIWTDSASMSVPGKLDEIKLGAFILGRKGGPFFLNLNGIEDTTADLWFTRSWNRQFGRMTSPNLAVGEQIINQPRAIERGAMKEWNQDISRNIRETEQDSQAILWYFEQQLFNSMGQKSAKPSKFSDGAKQFIQEGGRGRFGAK